MPRIAMAAPATDEDASSTRVDDLIQRGRSQGHLSLSDLRTAFEQAGLTPAEARAADADAEFGDDEMASIEADVASLADGVDLDDQTPAMGDSVHTYLKSIGRTSLLTAEQE